MKKYMLLFSVFALAACHDGNHHSGGVNIQHMVTPGLDMPTAVQSWNDSGVSIAYAGAPGDTNNLIFTLDNDGNVTSIKHDGDTYVRNGNSNEYVYREPDKTTTMNIATFGKDMGLQYADFGYAMETERDIASTERDFYVFTGGRNMIVRPDVKDATYTGTAVAYIEAKTPTTIANQISVTDDASLVVDAAGKGRLSMNFSSADKPWYDVVVEDGKILLNGDAAVAPEFKVTPNMVQDSPYIADLFYGIDGTPSEVTYRVGAEYEDKVTGRDVEFDAAFGGARQ